MTSLTQSSPVTADSTSITLGDPQAVRYPKRKRKEVRYYASDDAEGDSSDDTEDELPLAKRAKTEANSRPLPKKQIFPFLSLPPELRNRIYELVLTDPNGHHLMGKLRSYRRVAYRVSPKEFKEAHNNWWNRRRAWWRRRYQAQTTTATNSTEEEPETFVHLSPNILAVCKTIYAEAIGLLYSKPVVLTDTSALLSFTTQIGPKHRAMLRDLEIANWGYTPALKAVNFPAVSLLADATQIERLKINIRHWGGPSWVAKKVFRDCYIFLQAFGDARCDKFAGIDIIELPEDLLQAQKPNNITGQMESFPLEKRKDDYQNELKRLLN